jgi:hypothetical protein
MARHAIVDLAQVFNTPPVKLHDDRLSPPRLQDLREQLAKAGLRWEPELAQELQLLALREMYEPYIAALAEHFLVELPPWSRPANAHDNWRTSRWGGSVAA